MTDHVHSSNPLADLGALVRQRREGRALSQDALADLAGVSRTTLTRLERRHSKDVPSANSVAKVLLTLDIAVEEATSLIHDDKLAGELVLEMACIEQVHAISMDAKRRRRPYARLIAQTPDLVAIHPDGTMLYIEVKQSSEESDRRGEDLVRVLGSIGYLVTRPAGRGEATAPE